MTTPGKTADEALRASLQQVMGLVAQGRLDQAEARTRQLLAAVPEHPQVNYVLGGILTDQRKFQTAAPHFLNAVRRQPRNPLFLVAYGRNLIELFRYQQAEAALKRAVALAPAMCEAHHALGVFYSSVGQDRMAAECFEKALQSPMSKAAERAIHACWMTSLRAAGDLRRSEQETRAFIARGDALPEHIYHLGAFGKFEVGSAEDRLVDAQLAKPGLSADDRYRLLHRRAAFLLNSGEAGKSFEVLLQAKTVLNAPFDLAEITAHVDACLAVLDRGALERMARTFGGSRFAPIYVIGLPRSGTTLCERILTSHEAVASAGETGIIATLARRLLGTGGAAVLEASLAALGLEGITAVARDVEEVMTFLGQGKPNVIDKMPHNFLYIGLIAVLFPRARFVHCHRNPADNFLSALRVPLNATHAYSFTPERFAGYYEQYARLMRHWDQALPGRIYSLNYERLVSEPRPVVSTLLSFLGLDWREACLSPENNAASVMTYSSLQVRNPINDKSVGGWRVHEPQLEGLERTLAPLSDFDGGSARGSAQ